MLLFTAETPPITSPLISIVTETPAEVEQPPIYTIEEKIKLNINNCNEAVEWIRADTAECLPKRVNRPIGTQNTPQTIRNSSDGTNTYSPGYCTWYVKNQLSWVPNGWGNANRWASNARSQGYTVSTTPVVGSVAQTSGGSLGHVAVVVAVNGETVTITEMNQQGRYVISTRTIPTSASRYIY